LPECSRNTITSLLPQNDNIIRECRISGGSKYQDAPIFFSESAPSIEKVKPKVGDYVACVYNSGWYLGLMMVENLQEDDSKIKFLLPKGPSNSFHWETREGKRLPNSAILKIIDAPTTETGRQYKIPKKLSDTVNLLFHTYMENE